MIAKFLRKAAILIQVLLFIFLCLPNGFAEPSVSVRSMIETLKINVQDLIPGGLLSNEDGKKLIKKLDKALKNLDKGRPDKLTEDLKKYIKEINKLIKKGTLGESEGQALISQADEIIEEPCTDCQHYIFLTSTAYTGNLGGLAGADALCASHASNGTLTNPLGLNWKALISVDGVIDARDRVIWLGAVYDVTGLLVTNDPNTWPWVADGLSEIGVDENGDDPPDSYVWTGSNVNGVSKGANYDCNGWTSSDPADDGWAGETAYFDWDQWIDSFYSPCHNDWYSIYCVSDPSP